ncbi:MAG: phosphoribosyltransferase family protein [Patescibacteria group bacterium]|nr:phosphoribosyltransferase family protein [Patescibacteria group bacterium]
MNLKNFFAKLLDIVFPHSQSLINLENMSEEELHKSVSKPRTISQELNIIAIFDYQNKIMKNMIWQLKYRQNIKIAKLLAHCLYQTLLIEIKEKSIIIPMPLSKERLRERQYNQMELLINELEKIDINKIFEYSNSILYKIKNTPHQTSVKSREERMKNLRDCFSIKDSEKIKDRNIILIDDVTTTGTTLSQARRVFLHSSAKKVFCVALAH